MCPWVCYVKLHSFNNKIQIKRETEKQNQLLSGTERIVVFQSEGVFSRQVGNTKCAAPLPRQVNNIVCLLPCLCLKFKF